MVFHNLNGYDSHLFVKNLGISDGNIDCIPNNEERYISFTKKIQVGSYTKKVKNNQGETEEKITHVHHQIRFIDSFKFMATSLDMLVNNLSKDAFNNVQRYYVENKHNLLTKIGIYPYEYMNSPEKLKETQLPPKEAFYSSLNDEGISDENYAHAREVWKTFEMKNLENYHNLYNKVDVLLLSDVFENFGNICYKNCNLDPAHYYTAPGLAWDAALKKAEVELELLSDPDMLFMFENGIRGGVSTVVTRYGKSNNKYMGDIYDPSKPTKYITYLDANNLYGWAMIKPLPTHGFKGMELNGLENWRNYSCVLEVDLEYSRSLHDLRNDYPLAPEQIKINNIKNLIPNLGDKEKYVLHYENLKQYLSLGLKLTKIHRGIKFEESQWPLKVRVDIKLVNDKKQAEKLTVNPNFYHCNIFSEELVAVHMKKTKLVFNKPVYLGMCILDLSKLCMTFIIIILSRNTEIKLNFYLLIPIV